MQFRGVLIHGRGRLGAAVGFTRAVELQCVDGMLAESAFECGAVAHLLFGSVISHSSL